MNLKQAMEVAALGGPEMGKPQQRLSAKQIARKVFKMAAAAGHPFTGLTSDQWAQKWLDSKEFVLMEIESTKDGPQTAVGALRNTTGSEGSGTRASAAWSR